MNKLANKNSVAILTIVYGILFYIESLSLAGTVIFIAGIYAIAWIINKVRKKNIEDLYSTTSLILIVCIILYFFSLFI